MDATVYKNFQSVGSDEAEHVSFLTTALQKVGVTATQACNYSFPVTDVNGFVAVASVLEGVGVSAYLGAAASIMEKAYLTAAGSILTVESRHSAYIRSVLKESPAPQPFDVKFPHADLVFMNNFDWYLIVPSYLQRSVLPGCRVHHWLPKHQPPAARQGIPDTVSGHDWHNQGRHWGHAQDRCRADRPAV